MAETKLPGTGTATEETLIYLRLHPAPSQLHIPVTKRPKRDKQSKQNNWMVE